MTPAKRERVRQALEWAQYAFGTTLPAYHRRAHRDTLDVCVTEAATLIANAGLAEVIAGWHADDHTSGRGRKAHLSETAALTLMLIQMRLDGRMLFTAMADTVHCMSPAQQARVGIRHPGPKRKTYDLIWRGVERLQRLVDPYPGPRHRRPTHADLKRIAAERDARRDELDRKSERLFTLCERLVEGSVHFLNRDARRRLTEKVNIAVDATMLPMQGRDGVRSGSRSTSRHSINFDAGWYRREGTHDGSGVTDPDKRIWGLEIEIACATRRTPDCDADAPQLALAMSWHVPGALTGHARKMLESMWDRGYNINHLVADRAYLPNSRAEDLQLPAVQHGVRIVSHYKNNQLGTRALYADATGDIKAILVDGSWYVPHMPDRLHHAYSDFLTNHDQAKTIRDYDDRKTAMRQAREELYALLHERSRYRLKPKGGFRPDGSRQYLYPNLDDIEFFYDTDGTIIEPRPTYPATIVIPATISDKPERALDGIKYGQEYEFQSRKWRSYWGLRNSIESFNQHIKNSAEEDIDNPGKRPARGNTFTIITAALAIASANIRKIIAFLQDELARRPVTSKNIHDASTYYTAGDIGDTTPPGNRPPPHQRPPSG